MTHPLLLFPLIPYTETCAHRHRHAHTHARMPPAPPVRVHARTRTHTHTHTQILLLEDLKDFDSLVQASQSFHEDVSDPLVGVGGTEMSKT